MKTRINKAHSERMQQLKQQLQQLNTIIGNKKICYLDIPVHNNVGDLLILKGTMEFFKANNYKVTHFFSCLNFHESAIADDVTIVFHGGGNFGDLYHIHQQHRERIIARFPNHKIVILPQTIYFDLHANYDKACAQLMKHNNLHICVRDQESYLLAKNMTAYVYLIPDMAHYLYPIRLECNKKSLSKSLYLKRKDIEYKLSEEIRNVDEVVDWRDVIGKRTYLISFMHYLQKIFGLLQFNSLTSQLTSKIWLTYVDYLLKYVINKVSQFNYIHSSRMHGYILANLLSIDSHLLDNSYSKNKHYYEAWMGILEAKRDANE
jgi:pyruvyl transferase EpsO